MPTTTNANEWREQFDLDHYEDVYSLYKAVEENDGYGLFQSVDGPNGTGWVINRDNTDTDLLLNTDALRNQFLTSLEQEFCGDMTMEGWYYSRNEMSKPD